MNGLLWAAWFGHVDALSILIKAGAGTESKNKNGLSFLHCAATNGHIEIINVCQQVLIHILKFILYSYNKSLYLTTIDTTIVACE